jgi:glycerate 2-kinase
MSFLGSKRSCFRWPTAATGTIAAAWSAGFDKIIVDTVGPTGEPVQAPYALQDDRAVVELAAVVGLSMLPGGRLDTMRSSTYGLGPVIADAIQRGAGTIVLGLGGSASTDGGAGMIQALGGRLTDSAGAPFPRAAALSKALPALISEHFGTPSAAPRSSLRAT